MRRLVPLFVLTLLSLLPAPAYALTIRDIVDLSRAGLGEEVLLALLEVDPSVFSIDTATLKALKEAGVSQRVIVAMIRSGRTPPPAPAEPIPVPTNVAKPEPASQPSQVIVIDHHDAPQVREVVVPVYVPVRRTYARASVSEETHRTRFIPTTGLSAPPPPPPVYWGFGGKLRPDAWQPTPAPTVTRRER